MLMYCDLWTKWSKIEMYTGTYTARDFAVSAKTILFYMSHPKEATVGWRH